VAVGLGIVLARAARERQLPTLPERERRLGLRPDEPVAVGLRRMALGQVDIALELLVAGNAGGPPTAEAVHETRKALKRLRALLRLLRAHLGEDAFERENVALRDIAKRLSGARDAEVMLGTLDTLIARHPRKLANRKGVHRLRRTLLAEHERMRRLTLGDGATRTRVLMELREFRRRAAAWPLAEHHRTSSIDVGLKHLYRQGRARHSQAAGRQGKDTLAMHRWRKRVKDLRYAAEMLEREPRPKAKQRRQQARLRRLAKHADELGEALGEDHDLAVFAELVRVRAKRQRKDRRHRDSSGAIGRGTRKTLLELIAKRRRKLRKQALRDGERLYHHSPKRFIKRLSSR
jgi:CHAD domain-containing protein